MKKGILLATLIMIIALTGCSNTEMTTDVETEEITEVIAETEEVKETVEELVETLTEEVEDEITSSITLEDVMNAPESPAEDFEYSENETGGIIIDAYIGTDEIVVIPSEIDGLEVQEMGAVFEQESDEEGKEDNTITKGVRLPDTMTAIGENAFALNDDIEIIVLGEGLKTIGVTAFFSTTSLTSLELPDGLEIIERGAFWWTGIEALEVPASVTGLGAYSLMVDVIIGEEGSAAETFASENGIEFQIKE